MYGVAVCNLDEDTTLFLSLLPPDMETTAYVELYLAEAEVMLSFEPPWTRDGTIVLYISFNGYLPLDATLLCTFN